MYVSRQLSVIHRTRELPDKTTSYLYTGPLIVSIEHRHNHASEKENLKCTSSICEFSPVNHRFLFCVSFSDGSAKFGSLVNIHYQERYAQMEDRIETVSLGEHSPVMSDRNFLNDNVRATRRKKRTSELGDDFRKNFKIITCLEPLICTKK
jgi:hypothetical protein